ncbi:unnamed protein product, partial [Laminaria digitata]
NIVELVDVYENEANLHLAREFGGELFDRIIQKTESEEGRYSERDAVMLVSKMLSAISYCHDEHNICHRDLKPENFLFKDNSDDSEIKIIDFGLSRFEEMNEVMTTRVGTPYCEKICYTEASSKRVSLLFFIWALAYPWAYIYFDREIFASVQRGDYDFPSPEWDTVEDAGSASKLDAPIQLSSRLKRFIGMNHLKRTALNVIANQLTEADIGHLRGVFLKIDADNNGSICIDELKMGVDVDGNDSIEWEEFLAATIDRNLFIREDNVRRAFQYFDIEGTGSITIANLVLIFGSEDHAREIVGKFLFVGSG